MVRSELKRDTLIRNIKRAIARAQSENLPATIKEVYAFGGILRDKERAHDFDAIFLCDQTPEQEARWRHFCCCFGQACTEIEEKLLQKSSVNPSELRKKVYAILTPYYKQGVSLRKTATLDSVAQKLKNMDIEPSWVGCFSWTEVFFNIFGLFRPSIEKVLRTFICRGMKGIQVFFENYKSFKKDPTWPARSLTWPPKNYRIAWSPEKPDVEKNLRMRSEEKVALLKNELKSFMEQLVQLKEDFLKIQNELTLSARNLGITLNLQRLTSKHIDVSYDENETYNQLRAKCEQARQEMRVYKEETTVVASLLDSIESFKERKNDPFFSKYPPHDWITYWTILGTPKLYAKERSIREILKDLGLPENHVVTIRHVGYTDYELEPDETKRKELLKKAETAEKERRLTFKLRKSVREMQPSAIAYVNLTNEDKAVELHIHHKPAKDDKQNKLFIEKWRKKGFKTEQSEWYLTAEKSLKLTGIETLSDIEKLLVKAIETQNPTQKQT